MFDAFAENGKAIIDKGHGFGGMSGNSWQKELGNPTVLHVRRSANVTAQTGQRISVSITGATCVLENTTQKLILPERESNAMQTTMDAKCRRWNFEWYENGGGGIDVRPFAPGNTFIIPATPRTYLL